jgi:hypothetical protein
MMAQSNPTIAVKDDAGLQRIYNFATNFRHLIVNYWDGSAWHWADQGNPLGDLSYLSRRPTAIAYQDEAGKARIYVFAEVEGSLYINFWDGAQWRWANQGHPSVNMSEPGAITYVDEAGIRKFYVFVSAGGFGTHTSYPRNLFVNYWDGAQWSWADQGNIVDQYHQPAGHYGDPGVITYEDEAGGQRIYAFVREIDSLHVNYWDGRQWGWANQGDGNTGGFWGTEGPPGVITFKDDAGIQRIYAFVQAPQSNTRLFVNYWDGMQWQWADLGTPPGTYLKAGIAPNVITFRDENGKQGIYVFVLALDKHLWVNYWDGMQWQWADQGTPGPDLELEYVHGAVTYSEGRTQRIYVFAESGGIGSRWYVNYWDGAAWHWADQGVEPRAPF